MRKAPALTVVALTLAALAAGCGGGSEQAATTTMTTTTGSNATSLPQGSEPVGLDPTQFTTTIDNPYWPMRPGSRWVYRESDPQGGTQRVVVTVTPRTKTIMGIEARVVHDIVTEGKQLVEDTFDWYAQDADGNVWYMGEATKEYENGKLKTTAGSWQAGVDGAQPGVIVPAQPEPGLAYRQEYYKGQAEDAAAVLSVDERAEVPYGSFDHVLLTKEFTPLEPTLLEHKFYAQDVGPVLAVTVSGGSDREELIRYKAGS